MTERARGKLAADYTGWYTKGHAAAAIGGSTKTVERLADDKQIRTALWKPPSGGPTLRVFDPDDVRHLAEQRNPAFTLDGPLAVGDVGSTQALERRAAADPQQQALQQLLQVVRALPAPAAPEPEPFHLTLAQAAKRCGLPQQVLRQACEDGRLPAFRGRGWRIHRDDLAAFRATNNAPTSS